VTFYHNTEKKMMNIHFHRVELVNDLGIPSLPDVGSETSESAESSSDIEEGQRKDSAPGLDAEDVAGFANK